MENAMSEDILPLEQHPEIRELIARELAEDVGPGDATTLALVGVEARASARIVARHDIVVAGGGIAAEVFRMADEKLNADVRLADGESARPGDAVLHVEGSARAILAAERTALNLFQRMTGIATATECLVRIVSDYGTQILDTRKTVPGLRLFDKWAVRLGGAANHRTGLYDMALIKDNHIAAVGSITEAVRRVRAGDSLGRPIEVEVTNLAQLAEAVRLAGGRIPLEASGGVTLRTVRSIAETGVDYISIGALTHSVNALDISLDLSD